MGRRRGWDSNPRGLSPNALAGRRLKPLGHPSKLPLLGSNQDSPDPESGVLPVTPRGKVQRLAFQTAIYAPAASGPTLDSNSDPVQNPSSRSPRATSRNRTDDPVITSDVLYHLSYGGGGVEPRGVEPLTSRVRF